MVAGLNQTVSPDYGFGWPVVIASIVARPLAPDLLPDWAADSRRKIAVNMAHRNHPVAVRPQQPIDGLVGQPLEVEIVNLDADQPRPVALEIERLEDGQVEPFDVDRQQVDRLSRRQVLGQDVVQRAHRHDEFVGRRAHHGGSGVGQRVQSRLVVGIQTRGAVGRADGAAKIDVARPLDFKSIDRRAIGVDVDTPPATQ